VDAAVPWAAADIDDDARGRAGSRWQTVAHRKGVVELHQVVQDPIQALQMRKLLVVVQIGKECIGI